MYFLIPRHFPWKKDWKLQFLLFFLVLNWFSVVKINCDWWTFTRTLSRSNKFCRNTWIVLQNGKVFSAQNPLWKPGALNVLIGEWWLWDAIKSKTSFRPRGRKWAIFSSFRRRRTNQQSRASKGRLRGKTEISAAKWKQLVTFDTAEVPFQCDQF